MILSVKNYIIRGNVAFILIKRQTEISGKFLKEVVLKLGFEAIYQTEGISKLE